MPYSLLLLRFFPIWFEWQPTEDNINLFDQGLDKDRKIISVVLVFQIKLSNSARKSFNKTIGFYYICGVILVDRANLWRTAFPNDVSVFKEYAFDDPELFSAFIAIQCGE